jgi:hypothetical protein
MGRSHNGKPASLPVFQVLEIACGSPVHSDDTSRQRELSLRVLDISLCAEPKRVRHDFAKPQVADPPTAGNRKPSLWLAFAKEITSRRLFSCCFSSEITTGYTTMHSHERIVIDFHATVEPEKRRVVHSAFGRSCMDTPIDPDRLRHEEAPEPNRVSSTSDRPSA